MGTEVSMTVDSSVSAVVTVEIRSWVFVSVMVSRTVVVTRGSLVAAAVVVWVCVSISVTVVPSIDRPEAMNRAAKNIATAIGRATFSPVMNAESRISYLRVRNQ